MTKVRLYKTNRQKRITRVRGKIRGTATTPRLSVYRSNKYIYGQMIDDISGKTLLSVSDKAQGKGTKTEKAKTVGKEIALQSLKLGIKQAVFDRRGYRYHGRVKNLAEGAREGGLKV